MAVAAINGSLHGHTLWDVWACHYSVLRSAQCAGCCDLHVWCLYLSNKAGCTVPCTAAAIAEVHAQPSGGCSAGLRGQAGVQVFIGLLVGYIIAAIAPLDGKKFVTSEKLDAAPGITFLFVETFPLGVYGPGVLPLLIAFIVTTVRTLPPCATMRPSVRRCHPRCSRQQSVWCALGSFRVQVC